MIRKHIQQKGFALVTSLLLLLLMTMMGIAMTARSNLNTNMSVSYDRSEHIFLAAEAGIEHARRYLENSSSNNVYPTNENPPTTTSAALTAVPLNGCLADYQDGIGGAGAQQFDTLGGDWNPATLADNGRYAYRFPQTQTGANLPLNRTCAAINANPNLEVNYRRMDCEIASNDADINEFLSSFGFSYYIFYEGASSGTASTPSVGTGSVGSSTEYADSSQGVGFYYKVISCGAAFERRFGQTANAPSNLRQIETIEARIALSN